MPEYQFSNPNTGEIVTIFQSMSAKHEYEEDGIKYDRVWSAPNSAIDSISNIDPFSKQQFLKNTDKRDTLGSIWDKSKELSERRAEKSGGVDPVKSKWMRDYSKKRKGIEFPK